MSLPLRLLHLMKRSISMFLLSIILIESSISSIIVMAEGEVMHSLDELPSWNTETSDLTIPQISTHEITPYVPEENGYESRMDLLPSIQEEIKRKSKGLKSQKKSKKIKLSQSERLEIRSGEFRRTPITVELPAGVEIRESRGDFVDPALVGVAPLGVTEKAAAKKSIRSYQETRTKQTIYKPTPIKKKPKALLSDLFLDMWTPSEVFAGELKTEQDMSTSFEFGVVGQHLIFSQPVKIRVRSSVADQSLVDILVRHSGDTTYNTSGLSTDPRTKCLPDGSTTLPSTLATVRDGWIEFYTCGASRFTMNPGGGVSGSNDFRLIVGDCGQAQLYYNGTANIYGGSPAASGCNLPSLWINLAIGTTVYGNARTAWSTQGTIGSQSGNTYTATTTMTTIKNGLTYTLILFWTYTAPDKFFTLKYNLIVPTGNTEAIKLYIGNDSYVGGSDANDVGYSNTVPSKTVGVYDNILNQLSAIRYISGEIWGYQEVAGYSTISSRIANRQDFTNTIKTTAGDLGFGINWNYGILSNITKTSTLEWRVLPYVSTDVPDLIPGIGAPATPMQVGVESLLPVTMTNVGNTGSVGVITTVLSFSGLLIDGPLTASTISGWGCGATVIGGTSSTVTCTKNISITPLGSEAFGVPLRPKAAAAGKTARFDLTISNASDSNTTNNAAFSTLLVGVAPPPTDTVPPVISSISPTNNQLIPGEGVMTLSYNYSDTGSNINQTTATGSLYKWNGSSWVLQIGALTPTSISATSTTFSSSSLTFGKYRFDVSIRDNQNNLTSASRTFWIDRLEWTVSSGSLDIGSIVNNAQKISTQELLVTVKTVGAGYRLDLDAPGLLAAGGVTIPHWNGIDGYGYDADVGSGYSGSIRTISPWKTLITQVAGLDTNGLQITRTYRVKLGLKPNNQHAGSYSGNISLRFVSSYP